MHPLQDKVVLITGGSSGIGRATALRLAGYGARLALAARTATSLSVVADELKALGREALTVPTDVTEARQCRAMVPGIVS